MSIKQYSFGEILGNCIHFGYTKVRFHHARLIRLPFYLRGAPHLQYGKGLTLGYGCRFDLNGQGKTLILGKNCKFNDRVHIVAHESVQIGDNALLASNIFISDTSHGNYSEMPSNPEVAPDDRILFTRPVRIGNNVWIGEGVCILPGTTIGDGCIIGANAVVSGRYTSNTIIAGVPARIIKRWNDEKGTWEREVDNSSNI